MSREQTTPVLPVLLENYILTQQITFPKLCAVEDMHMDNTASSIMSFELWDDALNHLKYLIRQ